MISLIFSVKKNNYILRISINNRKNTRTIIFVVEIKHFAAHEGNLDFEVAEDNSN